VVLGLRPTTAELRLVAAVRPAAVALLVGRPERAVAIERAERIREALGTPRIEPAARTTPEIRGEIGLIRDFLFAQPELLAREDRARSPGPDGTVTFEQHPSVSREIDAAVSWVMEQVATHRTPLEDIALVVPARDPLCGMLATALERPDKGGDGGGLSIPAYVAGGLPVANSPSGSLVLQVLLALRDALECERTIALLPHLRLAEAHGHLSEGDARDLVYRSGVVGGTPGNRERAREWPVRLRERREGLTVLLARMSETEPASEDDPEKARWTVERDRAEEVEARIGSILPAVEVLTELAAMVLDGAALGALWAAIRGFLERWCRIPPDPPRAAALLDAAVSAVCGRDAEPLAGRDAVDHVVAVLEGLRHPHGRFGEPRVFVGTAADAMYLRFRAVRVLGAVEGAIPGTPREDPLLPDAARAWFEDRMREGHCPDCLIECSSDRGLRETHQVFLACVAARERLALSAPRRWLDDTDRELAGLMLEAAVALGRHDPQTGTAEVVPSLRTLRRVYVGHGIDTRRVADEDLPAASRLVLRSVAAAGGTRVPPAWLAPPDGVVSLARLRAIAAAQAADDLGPADGALGDAAAWLRVPGLSDERGISASALATLLACPHRYLFERVLHLGGPVDRPSTREIAPLQYGSLVHRVLEDFFRRDGERFCRREATLEEWTRRARKFSDGYLADFLGEYALADSGTIEAQRARLHRDLGDQLRAAWRDGLPAEFVGVEMAFGQPRALPLAVGGGRTLWVQGRIDRLERTAAGLVLRDVKTGKCKVGEESSLDLDLQIALYDLVAPALVPGVAVESAGYVYSVRAGDAERLFAGEDLRQLEADSREWLGLAAEMLEACMFPHAPDPKLCEQCDFSPACGADAAETATRKLKAALAGTLARRIATHYFGEEDAGD
jgi:hypothetical protein